MKNVTLSIPEQLLTKARKYASRHNTSLNAMIREFLQKRVNHHSENTTEVFDKYTDKWEIDTLNMPFVRDEIYER